MFTMKKQVGVQLNNPIFELTSSFVPGEGQTPLSTQ